MLKTFKIVISGQVQGVGFRPFVFLQARELGLKGYVCNNEEGVVILASGEDAEVSKFYKHLLEGPPPVARITDHRMEEVAPAPFTDFEIRPSKKNSKLNLQLTPDFGICEKCAGEIEDAGNRRFAYPFTTCVHCGPRWSLTNTFPFERSHTTIDAFPMCGPCREEYGDPGNRRFHSQTNTCPDCGPSLRLCDANGKSLEHRQTLLLGEVASLIGKGKIVAIRNTGGYLLCCDATDPAAVQRLRERKRRPGKPFALLYPDLSLLEAHLPVKEVHKRALLSAERPIVILPGGDAADHLALEELAPGLRQLGVMLPNSALLELLSEHLTGPVVATSGNIHGSPILSEPEQAEKLLAGVADYFVHHDLHIANPQDDSVVKFSFKHGQQVLFRRSRGYAPNGPDATMAREEKILALGAHLKSTVAYVPNDFLYISQYLGNLDHYDVYTRFCDAAENFLRIFEQDPQVILVDAHPEYHSTRYGEEMQATFDAGLFRIQHHKAHFASVLGEHGLFASSEPILGVIWDGTGFGEDGEIWGGEFFRYQGGEMDRLGHIAYYDWLAGDKMAREPRLSLLSLATKEMEDLVRPKFSPSEWSVYETVKKSNSLKTSSVGRLFDAVASLLGICDQNTYEGEAAIRLENALEAYDLHACKSYIGIGPDGRLSAKGILEGLAAEVRSGMPVSTVIANFLFTLAKAIFETAANYGIRRIACSGGVFQNTTLIDMIKDMTPEGTEVYFNRKLAPNDENISYGQVMFYQHLVLGSGRQGGSGRD